MDEDEWSEDLPKADLPPAVASWLADMRAMHRSWRGDRGPVVPPDEWGSH